MIEKTEFDRVLSLISWWLTAIKSHNAIGFFDINKVAEGVALKLLNEIYGYQLENLNHEKNNYPGIDLGDKKNKIAFQITSQKDAKKIQENLEKFVKGANEIYSNGIRFLILSQDKKPHLSKKKYQNIYTDFEPAKHILTANDILQEIKHIYDTEKEKFNHIKDILEGSVRISKNKSKRRIWQKLILVAATFISLILISFIFFANGFIPINSINETKKMIESEEQKERKKVERFALIKKNKKNFLEADFGDGIIMIYIPGGNFSMGQTEAEMKWLIGDGDDKRKKYYNTHYSDERPLKTIYLDGYWIGKTEVTKKQFNKFIQATGYVTDAERIGYAYSWAVEIWEKKNELNWRDPGFEQESNHPVVCISWNDAKEYCKWLSNKIGLHFDLPTEAQWEKAARGIGDQVVRKYPWGNGPPYYKGKWYANYRGYDFGAKGVEDGYEYTAPVGSYPHGISPYGAFEMAGNVDEWCNDWYIHEYYRNGPKDNPPGPLSGYGHTFRGGGWNRYGARDIRCAYRANGNASASVDVLGFRLCQRD